MNKRATDKLVLFQLACWIILIVACFNIRTSVEPVEIIVREEVGAEAVIAIADQDTATIARSAVATPSLDKQAGEGVGVAVGIPSGLTSATPQRQVVAPTPSACLTDEMLSLVGVSPTDYGFARAIVFKESTCNYLAKNPNSSAVGLCQAMASIHVLPDNYLTDPAVQMQWCHDYAIRRYGSWANAWAFWQQNRWW